MSKSKLILFSSILFSGIGSVVPSLWGDDFLSLASVFTTALGGVLGIVIGLKLSDAWGID